MYEYKDYLRPRREESHDRELNMEKTSLSAEGLSFAAPPFQLLTTSFTLPIEAKSTPNPINSHTSFVLQRNDATNDVKDSHTTDESTKLVTTGKDSEEQLLSDDSIVEGIVSNFPDQELQKQLNTIPEGISKADYYRTFLKNMKERHLGSLVNVITHFSAIRKANVPGDVHLHDFAASALEKVKEKIESQGGVMPASTVALGLRGRPWSKKKEGKGMMSHPCGFAIDWRATTNPHLTNSNLKRLIEIQTGGQVYMKLGSYIERRSIIKQMGEASMNGTTDPELAKKSQKLLENLEIQFGLVRQTSEKFQSELPDTREEFFSLHSEYKEINKKLGDIAKNRKKINQKDTDRESKLSELSDQEQKLNTQKDEIKAKLPRIFEPWILKIDFRIGESERKLLAQGFDPDVFSTPTAVELKIKSLKDEIERLKKELKPGKKKDGLAPERKMELTDLITKATDDKKTLESEFKNLTSLKAIKSDLTTNMKFVFEGDREVQNPSIVQLIKMGHFNADNEPAEGEKPMAHKHGFNLLFFKTMAQHGFDLGGAWESPDTMHFELVSGLDKIS